MEETKLSFISQFISPILSLLVCVGHPCYQGVQTARYYANKYQPGEGQNYQASYEDICSITQES